MNTISMTPQLLIHYLQTLNVKFNSERKLELEDQNINSFNNKSSESNIASNNASNIASNNTSNNATNELNIELE